MPRTRRRPSCHPEREHFGRGLCPRCYWAAYTAGAFIPKTRKMKHSGPGKRKKSPRAIVEDLEPILTPQEQAEEQALETWLAFERAKADRRRHARQDAERHARNPLTRQHPLYADKPLVQQMVLGGYVSWGAVQRMRELRQQAGWSLKSLAELFGVRVSFVALATSHLDLNVIDIPSARRVTA